MARLTQTGVSIALTAWLAACGDDVTSGTPGEGTVTSGPTSRTATAGNETSVVASDPTIGSSMETSGIGTGDSSASAAAETTGMAGMRCDEPDAMLPGWTCNLWNDDCPDGSKCYSSDVSEAHCVAVIQGATEVGGACDFRAPADECVRGAFCFSNLCHQYCSCSEIEPMCGDPCAICSLFDGGTPPVCTIPCDPFGASCAGVSNCITLNSGSHCFGGLVAGFGEACGGPGTCAEGFACVGATNFSECSFSTCCSPVCQLGDDAPCVEALGPMGYCAQSTDQLGCPFSDAGVCLTQ